MNTIIAQIKKFNPDLKLKEIEGLFYILLQKEKISNAELTTQTGLPKETLKVFKSGIQSMLEKSEDQIQLNSESREILSGLNLEPYKWVLYKPSNNAIESKLYELRSEHKLLPKRDLDQFFATVETSVAKALVLQNKGLISGKRIALLGDDDLVSICISLLDTTYSEIVVFDIDDELIAAIEAIKTSLGIKNIRTIKYDARSSLQPVLHKTFDVVVTDPPYTKSGTKLFITRGIELLRAHKSFEGSYIFLYYGNSFKTPEKTLKVQEIINDFNLVVEDKINNFANYLGADSIGNSSSLYILKNTPSSLPTDYIEAFESIYTFSNQKEEKFPFVDHYVFKLFNVPSKIIKSKKLLSVAMDSFCNKHKLKVMDRITTNFKGGGLTLTYILSSSNLLVHTWEEFNALHIDLITCSPIVDKPALLTNLSKLFETTTIEMHKAE